MRKWLVLSIIGLIVLGVLVFRGFNPLELKTKSGLQITTNDVPASLFLDDQYLDKSPFFDKKIQPRAYTLRIHPDDASLAPYELPVTLNKGMVTVVTWKPGPTLETSGGVIYEMEKLGNRADAQLEFQSIPDGAILTVDGGTKQFSPVLMTDLSEGHHEFEMSLPSFETQQHSVTLAKGHKVTITVFLGKINIGDSLEPATVETDAATAASPDSTASGTITGPAVQILSTNFFTNDQEVLRVRTTASPVGAELGFAPVGETYPFLSEVAGWFQIQFEGQPGWVSSQFSQKINTNSAQTIP